MITARTSRSLVFFGVLVIVGTLVSAYRLFQHNESAALQPDAQVVATVGNRSIFLRDIEQTVALSLYEIDQQRNRILSHALQRKIEETLLEAEAAQKGLSTSQLLDNASQSETIARLANLPAPVKRMRSDSMQKDQRSSALDDQQEQARIRQAVLVSLRRKTAIQITLEPPQPPILPVPISDDPSIGPINAPITIVEFSDFQCPYCRNSVSILKELRNLYGEQIQLIYRDFPGPNHPHAGPAAEAALCAKEQGKFWEYHDLLFERQTPGQGWDFVALAKERGLQLDRFENCLATERHRDDVAKDLKDGFKLGITSTPTFFINGRPLVGAKPVADFRAMIDKLLKQQSPS
ncbi:MAG: thioredoxin domain-containing protein [Nitrospira sp.]|nr:thioredoxin domain-containing protein [Nitrospira sp.]